MEHFRPKGGYKQRESDALRYPGYYWLAYEWANLFHSCQLCNQQWKKNLFPLRDGRSRARSHTHRLDKEQPLLLDPGGPDVPADHIGFRREVAFAVGNSVRGAVTIATLGLNRDDLIDLRRRYLEDLEALVDLCRLLQEEVKTNPDPATAADFQKYSARLREKSEPNSQNLFRKLSWAFSGSGTGTRASRR